MKLTPSCGHAPALLLSLLATTATAAVFAADTPATPQPAPPSKEMRAQMATIHEQMAACLRSDKPVADCRAEMIKSCQKVGCPTGMMGAGPKGMHGGMMQSAPPSPPSKQ